MLTEFTGFILAHKKLIMESKGTILDDYYKYYSNHGLQPLHNEMDGNSLGADYGHSHGEAGGHSHGEAGGHSHGGHSHGGHSHGGHSHGGHSHGGHSHGHSHGHHDEDDCQVDLDGEPAPINQSTITLPLIGRIHFVYDLSGLLQVELIMNICYLNSSHLLS